MDLKLKKVDRTDRNLVAGKEGFEPDQIYTYRSFPAKRITIVGPSCGKPSIVRLKNGEILLSYIKGYSFTASYSQIEIVRSKNSGKTWSEPICAVHPSHYPRDNYLILLRDGTLLLAFFKFVPWDYHPMHGPYLVRSTDGGHTWEEPEIVDISNICAGPWAPPDRSHVQLPDGIFLFFIQVYEDTERPITYVLRSKDNGKTFFDKTLVSDIAGDSSFVLLPSGKILGALRINYVDWTERGAHLEEKWRHENIHFMALTESNDNGYTWSKPIPLTNLNEIPGHLLVLKNGTVVFTFTIRHYPLGVQAMVSKDEGKTWNKENRTILAWHGSLIVDKGFKRQAVGHPYSVEISDGEILTAYYCWDDPLLDPNSCQIEGVFWNLKGIA